MQITAIEKQRRRRRANVYLDGRYAFSLRRENLRREGVCWLAVFRYLHARLTPRNAPSNRRRKGHLTSFGWKARCAVQTVAGGVGRGG
jgi:hypothetical protein